ncbi:hypothetical protein [Nitrospirillum sp. BR 11163]|uniref:hypothetical protein n=1 Tax=Nitrospirillum sp. BR 11163 TaxID=3104323 RepID=UPI002AFF95D8|nr:hypothetical protein [Nitrospirillum sp. BR 11163]MEA1677702.1 hypothetical protein [Nitrospirillum sp. BR 11163]
MLALYPLAGLLDPLLVSAVPGWAPWNVRAGIGLALVMVWGPRRLPLMMAAAVAGLALRAVLVPASPPWPPAWPSPSWRSPWSSPRPPCCWPAACARMARASCWRMWMASCAWPA